MARPGSLRHRLTITYTAALALGLLLFSALSLTAIDETLRSALDARLATTARAFAATAAGHVRRSKLDAATTSRLQSVLGFQQNGAIVHGDGIVAMQSATIPASVADVGRQARDDRLTYTTVSAGGYLRVAALRLPGIGNSNALALLWRPLDLIDDYEHIAETTFAVVSLLILVGALAAGSAIVEKALRPLRGMAAVASQIEAHDLSKRLADDAWDAELGDLALTFDRMLDRLEAAFLRQRQFTADASHDLRAPLAVMQAEVDLALARPRSDVPDEEAFLSIRDEVQEFDRLTEALLLAARTDNGPVRTDLLALRELGERAIVHIGPFAASRGVCIINSIASAALVVGDPDILERVIISLLHNGIKFSPKGGVVRLSTLESATTISLIISDKGPGFSEQALSHAFDRFWKDDTARGRDGTGLGLSIAKTAVERLGGSIRIRNLEGSGAEIETVLPSHPRY